MNGRNGITEMFDGIAATQDDQQRQDSEDVLRWAIAKERREPGWAKKYLKEIVPADKVTINVRTIPRW